MLTPIEQSSLTGLPLPLILSGDRERIAAAAGRQLSFLRGSLASTPKDSVAYKRLLQGIAVLEGMDPRLDLLPLSGSAAAANANYQTNPVDFMAGLIAERSVEHIDPQAALAAARPQPQTSSTAVLAGAALALAALMRRRG